jgi:hypothetical protein
MACPGSIKTSIFTHQPTLGGFTHLEFAAMLFGAEPNLNTSIGEEMNQTQRSIDLKRIYLDPENPRHEKLPNELAIIHHLVENEGVRAIAKSIIDLGGISPLEITALIPHPIVKTAFLVVEGNRRICALKLLSDPDKAANERDKKYFSALKTQQAIHINSVSAVIFDTRENAQSWFALRHEGEQGGAGTKPWDAKQKARFSLQIRGKNENTLALLVIDYARQHHLLADTELNTLSLTTLTRYLSNPVFRNTLGLVNKNSLAINVPTDEFERGLMRFLRDALAPDTEVNSRSDAKSRNAYATKLQQEGIAPTTRITVHQPHSPTTEALAHSPTTPPPIATPSKTVGPTRDKRHPDKRRFVVPSEFHAHITDKILQRLYKELKSIDATEHPFCAAYLLRTVLEKATVLYLTPHVVPEGDLHRKLLQLETQLKTDGFTQNQLKALRVMASAKDDPSSADTLGHYVHAGSVPSPQFSFRLWDSLQPIMETLLNVHTERRAKSSAN